MTNLHETDRLVELLPCPLFISDDFPHDVRIDEHVSGRAVRNVISCSCGIVFNGAYGDAGSLDGAANAREQTIAAWNRRALTAMGGKAEPVAWYHVPTRAVLDPADKDRLVARFSRELGRDVAPEFEPLCRPAALSSNESNKQ